MAHPQICIWHCQKNCWSSSRENRSAFERICSFPFSCGRSSSSTNKVSFTMCLLLLLLLLLLLQYSEVWFIWFHSWCFSARFENVREFLCSYILLLRNDVCYYNSWYMHFTLRGEGKFSRPRLIGSEALAFSLLFLRRLQVIISCIVVYLLVCGTY